MKKWAVMIIAFFFVGVGNGFGQSQEVQQLLLNVEKLAQFKQILSDMKKGYEILSQGYNVIKNISEGNFNLHETFLNALYQVSPTVRKYKKVGGIVELQLKVISQYKKGFNQFKASGQFTVDEINYLSKVYSRLVNESVKNLDDLTMVLTAGQTRMSDEERLAVIDRIYAEMEDKVLFLNQFNGRTGMLAAQRTKANAEVKVLQDLYRDK
jgi:hypothetical protein